MKRASSSSAKENSFRNSFVKVQTNQQKNYQNSIYFKSNSLIRQHTAKHLQTPNPYFHQFYKTFASNNIGEFFRPQSKQVYRRIGCRPQTSKGIRNVEKQSKRWAKDSKDLQFNSQYIAQIVREQIYDQKTSQIQIIVTRSLKKRKDEYFPGSQFETDLDDQFLQLFAS